MEFLLPFLSQHQGNSGFGPQFGCGNQSQSGPCSSEQARERHGAANMQHGQNPFGFDMGPNGFNLEDFMGTAAAFVASLADVQKQNANPCQMRQGQGGCKPSDGEFQVTFDVGQFKPEDLTVKTVDNFIVLEGSHEEREDGQGFISRQFKRRVEIPQGIDSANVKCSFTKSGQLVISAPKLVEKVAGTEKNIPIQVNRVRSGAEPTNEATPETPAGPTSTMAA